MEEDEYENGTTTTSSTGSSSKSKQSKQHQMKQTTTKNKKKKPIHYFSIDNEFIYWNFFLDFGPLNLGHLYRFCALLHTKLTSPAYRDHIICYYSGAEGAKRANATYLICAYQMLCLGRTLEESYFGFEPEEVSGGGEDDEDRRRRRYRIRNSRGGGGGWSNAAMAAVANSDDIEELLSNVSLPPMHKRLQQTQQPQHRRHFPHRLTNSGSGTSSSGKSASQSTTKSPFAPIHPLPPYHDASPIICTYDLTVYDCLAGLEKARQFDFFDFGNKITTPPSSTTTDDDNNNDEDFNTTTATSSTTPSSLFDIHEYEHYEQVENGDLNWIIANKICAFAGPLTKKSTPTSDNTEGMYYNLTPTDYIPYFQKRNVQLVIRLNNASCYDAQEFIDAGIQHVTHYYVDGSCPTMEILHNVVSDMEGVINRGEMMEFEEAEEEEVKDGSMDEVDDDMKQPMVGKQRRGGAGGGGAVAVHCKAGLGRTGTCIGAYIMKHYKFTAAEVIGYMRICRPGMVIGPQQHFLASIESVMWQEGDVYRMNIERLRGITVYAEEVDGDDGGLRKMSIDSNNGGDEEEEGGGRRMQQQPQAATTPRAKASSGSAVGGGGSGGAHVTIVTPDGQPFRLLTTPVNAKKIHIDSSNIDPSSSANNNGRKVNDYLMDTSSPAMLQPRPVPLSTKMDASTVNHSNGSSGHQLIDIDFANDNMQEGDQANELLSRRMNRHQVRH